MGQGKAGFAFPICCLVYTLHELEGEDLKRFRAMLFSFSVTWRSAIMEMQMSKMCIVVYCNIFYTYNNAYVLITAIFFNLFWNIADYQMISYCTIFCTSRHMAECYICTVFRESVTLSTSLNGLFTDACRAGGV